MASPSPHSPGSGSTQVAQRTPPVIPDHTPLRMIGRGSYGEVWLARNVMGTYRAVKVVYRDTFDNERPYEREFGGIRKFEPISRSHESQVQILHIGRRDQQGYFYYVMELADAASRPARAEDGRWKMANKRHPRRPSSILDPRSILSPTFLGPCSMRLKSAGDCPSLIA